MILLSVNWGNALIISFVGFLFVALLLIFLVGVVSVFGLNASRKKASTANSTTKEMEAVFNHQNITDKETAAIAAALNLYMKSHDIESNIITLKNIDRRYSPWSSKIYGINEI
jgi:sodium pump decarboxylase gamma subunit